MAYITFAKFIICASFIFYAGKRVAKYADAIAEKTGLSHLWIGIILVSLATSLPELFTGIGSVVLVDAPNLAVGNLLGANSYNLLNISLIDLLNGRAPLLSMVGSGQLLAAVFSLIPVILAAIAIILSEKGVHVFSIGNIGIFSIAIFLSYCLMAKVIYNFEKKRGIASAPSGPRPDEAGARNGRYGEIPLKKAWIRFGFASAVIAASGIWLAFIGKELSVTMRLSESFIGSLFIGLATTLPEITVSIAALLIGAREIAVANMLGSNLFNITILFVNDIFYKKGPLLQNVSPAHLKQAYVVMAMTAIIIIALITKKKRKLFNISWYAPILFAIFLLGAYFSFQMR